MNIIKQNRNSCLIKEGINYLGFIMRKGLFWPFFQRLNQGLNSRKNREVPLNYREILPGQDIKIGPFGMEFSPPFFFKIQTNFEEQGKDIKKIELDLAGEKILLEPKTDWGKQFPDRERLFSLHRFSWILRHLSKSYDNSQIEFLKNTILDWIQSNPIEKNAPGWDSYSISERLVNWIYFLSVIQFCGTIKGLDLNVIFRSMHFQVKHLLNHLEFRGASTNNHLINNARALYLCGIFFSNNRLRTIGGEILRCESRNMFTPSGFLREHSSHYHVLLCRTYLEVLWFGKAAGDDKFCEAISDRVKDMVECAQFLLEDGHLPLIGDVSPDFPPDFHMGLIEVGSQIFKENKVGYPVNTSGWHSLLVSESQPPRETLKETKTNEFNRQDNDFVAYSEDGYYRFKNGQYSIYIYVNPLGYVGKGLGHGHSDVGGFVLYWGGEPFFIDPGRSTYTNSNIGIYARSVRSHNSISIDGFEPCVVHGLNSYNPFTIKDYFPRPPQVRVEEKSNHICLHIEHFGFQRLKDDLVMKRTFCFYKESLVIEDAIKGSGKHLIETFFQLAPGIDIVGESIERIRTQREDGKQINIISDFKGLSSLNISRGQEGKQPAGWYFPRYGIKIPTNTIRFVQNMRLPVNNKYVVSIA